MYPFHVPLSRRTTRFIFLFLFFASGLLLFNQIALTQEPLSYAPIVEPVPAPITSTHLYQLPLS